jgi:hypothetical protein
MTTNQLYAALGKMLARHPEAGQHEAYVVICLCEDSQPAKDARFGITRVQYKDRHDLLEANEDGPAVELKIHQNESLRDWDTEAGAI